MKKSIFCILAILLLYNSALSQGSDNWNNKKSTHFIVYFKNAPEDFIDKVLGRSEDYYNRIAENLGFMRFDFWLWDNRAKIYIYNDDKDYRQATGQPNWSYGFAVAEEKVIRAFPYAKDFFDTILPHEMGHIIFREFVGFNNHAVPIWLDEGVAYYQENAKFSSPGLLIKRSLSQGRFINLQGLFHLNPQLMQDDESVNLFYAEAVSIVDYLIREFGKDNFVLFCQTLRDRKNLESAIRSNYPFNNIQELDEAWQKYLKE